MRRFEVIHKVSNTQDNHKVMPRLTIAHDRVTLKFPGDWDDQGDVEEFYIRRAKEVAMEVPEGAPTVRGRFDKYGLITLYKNNGEKYRNEYD